MSIQVKVIETNKELTYPAVRLHVGPGSGPDDREVKDFGPLVVLFLNPTNGIPLSGVKPARIGKQELWTECDDRTSWEPCSVTLTSET